MKDVRVSLVGAGPGDPGLLTVKAVQALERAQVVVHDHLVSDDILALVPRRAVRIYAGKQRGNHSLPQAEINALLVRLAREGRRVVRLKGGDPFIFGRGGEEAEALARAGIPFEVVPGVTAAAGVAAYAGIPLTHRGLAEACILVTGSRRGGAVELDWQGLARPGQTIVVYMGLHGLAHIAERLVAHGLPPRTPAAIIQRGTTPGQRVVEGTLGSLAKRAAAAGLRAPTLVVIGKVVRLRRKLDWFTPPAAPSRPAAPRRARPRPAPPRHATTA
ncbi:MAG: uroporphyrinogen-III C-methyltransferase [Burkholderiales bacterium]|nr:uroporphyrinogen-III C-methyltransferase [Burkholderiales bacterium]